jgi:hypothetical protein
MTCRTGHDRTAGPEVDEHCAVIRFVLEQANTAAEPHVAKRVRVIASCPENLVILEVVFAPLAPPQSMN